MEKKYRNVCDAIVSNDLCIGCGLCAGLCPIQVLEMRFNRYGEYIPVEYRIGCLPKCNICLRVCPFGNQDDNEDTLSAKLFELGEGNVHHSIETGYYLDSFAGYSLDEEHRFNAASGGLASWYLQSLLDKNLVDRVICVIPNNDPMKLFHFAVLEKPEELKVATRSCYYPVEMSQVIKQVLQTEGRYAIIGLPCFLKGIRLAMEMNQRLRKRIVVLAGLVCGQAKSKFFAEYLTCLGGGDPESLVSARFRIKSLDKPANNFGFSFECSDGDVKSGTVFWMDGMREAWVRGYFKPNACNYCDDIFAEVADVVFMDAWLERYISDSRGTNLVIRHPASRAVFEQGRLDNEIYLEQVTIQEVIQSQQAVIDVKRTGLGQRLALAKFLGLKNIPKKRVIASRPSFLCLYQRWAERQLTLASKRIFSAQRPLRSLARFEHSLFFPLYLLKIGILAQRLARRMGYRV